MFSNQYRSPSAWEPVVIPGLVTLYRAYFQGRKIKQTGLKVIVLDKDGNKGKVINLEKVTWETRYE